MFSLVSRTLAALGLLLLLALPVKAQPALEGYLPYEAFAAEVNQLGESELVSVRSLGKTLGARDIFLLTIGEGDAEKKPALLIVGNTHAPQLVGSEITLRMAGQLVERAEEDEQVRQLLAKFTLYVIPRPSPDASEHFFRAPLHQRATNERPTDDDRDGEVNEDGVEDLNDDGLITMLRVEDSRGEWKTHPDDPRLMIQADPKQGEQGRYLLFSEGIDNDGDEALNEDGPGGVAFDRNFTYAYPYFQVGAGPHQVSEVETRAVADFAFSRPNIAAVFCFGLQDNLMHPWKADGNRERDKLRPGIAAADAPYLKHIAEQYQALHGGKNAPASPESAGDFVHWSWFHYGRWTFAARGWWIPPVAANGDAQDEAAQKSSDEKRGADELNALRWFAQQEIEGFVEWTPIEHPDFPGQKVEVGGFKPYIRLNPPAAELDGLAEKHLAFVLKLGELMPQLKIEQAKVEALGGGLFRVTARVFNVGYLPTASDAGVKSEHIYPVQLAIELPEGAQLLTGHRRTQLPALAGRGGHAERSWVVQFTGEIPTSGKIRTWSPAVGEVHLEFVLQ